MGLRRSNVIVFQGGYTSTAFNDSTSYFWGCLMGSTAGTTNDIARLYAPCKCKIIKAVLFNLAFTTAGSSEDVSQYIRVNDTTDYLVETKGFDASKRTIWENYNMNIDLDRGDYIELKMVTPAWATNPAGNYGSALIFAQVLE